MSGTRPSGAHTLFECCTRIVEVVSLIASTSIHNAASSRGSAFLVLLLMSCNLTFRLDRPCCRAEKLIEHWQTHQKMPGTPASATPPSQCHFLFSPSAFPLHYLLLWNESFVAHSRTTSNVERGSPRQKILCLMLDLYTRPRTCESKLEAPPFTYNRLS